MIFSQQNSDDNDQSSEDHLAAKFGNLRKEDRNSRAAELTCSLDRRSKDDGDHGDVCDDPRRKRSRRKDAGRADRVVEAGRRQDSFDDRFQERPATKAMPIQRAAASTCGIAARISLSIAVAGAEIAVTSSAWSAAIATGMMISA